MTIDITVDTHELEQIGGRLDAYSDKVVKKALNSALSAAATPMMKDIRQRANVSEAAHMMHYGGRYVKVQPGLLKSSIRRRTLKVDELRKLNTTAGVAIRVGKGAKQKLYPRYWHFVEFGTSKMAPFPFLRPAFAAQKDVAIRRFNQKLTQNLDKLDSSA